MSPTIYQHVLDDVRGRESGKYGPLGTPRYITGHYTAGPVDQSDRHAMIMCQSYAREHINKGWGDLGYHFMITRKGNIILGRPVKYKGAHTGLHNSNNIGIVMCGTTGDKPSLRQRRAYQWLRRNAHKTVMPSSHRTPVSLAQLIRRGHNDWPDNYSNSCPGSFKPMYRRGF